MLSLYSFNFCTEIALSLLFLEYLILCVKMISVHNDEILEIISLANDLFLNPHFLSVVHNISIQSGEIFSEKNI